MTEGATRREAGETRHEALGVAGTRREGTSRPAGTRREGAVAKSFRMPLPPELADRFAVVEDLPSGVEADVAVVEGIDDGSPRVLKLYREGFSPDEKAVDRLVRADDWTHVVKIFESGWSWDGARFYEVLEFCQEGTLRSLLVEGRRPAVNDVVREVGAALECVHALDVVHRDLKPENLFVRTLSPLDLVLGDFGLVRSVDASVRWTMRWGTPAYAPPEFEGGEVSAAWDWWSLGMIVAELASGRHPFELPDATMLSDQQIRSSLAQRPVDLSGVDDTRARLLCQGLLTKDRHHRWGAAEVTAWLDGDTPAVVVDRAPQQMARARQVLFGGIEHDSPAELARSFQQHWAEAQRRLFQERDQTLVEEVERLLRQHQLDEADRLLASPSSAAEIPRHFADLLAEMDPDLEPLYDGIRLTPAGLESAAVEVIRAGGDHPSSKILDEVRRHNVLTHWRALPGIADAPDLHKRWIDADGELERIFGSLSANGYTPTAHDWALARAWVLACTVNPDHQCHQLSELVTGLDSTEADRQSWWHALRHAEDPGPCQLVATLLAHPTAVSQTDQQKEEARQREEEERRREGERLERARHNRRRFFTLCVRIVVGALLCVGYVCGPFLTVFLVVLDGHTSGYIHAWWKDLLAVGCFGWLVSSFVAVPLIFRSVIAGGLEGGPEREERNIR